MHRGSCIPHYKFKMAENVRIDLTIVLVDSWRTAFVMLKYNYHDELKAHCIVGTGH